MNKFERLLTKSAAIKRFADVERLNQDEVYEFFLECYCSYRTTFLERLKYGRQWNHVFSRYREIPEFLVLKISDLSRIVFASPVMVYWFAFQFWQAIDRQVAEDRIDKTELLIELTFISRIPTAETMEDILNERKENASNRISSARPIAETETRQSTAGVGVNG